MDYSKPVDTFVEALVLNRIDADLRYKSLLMSAGGVGDADNEDAQYKNTIQAVRATTQWMMPYLNIQVNTNNDMDMRALAESYLENFGNIDNG